MGGTALGRDKWSTLATTSPAILLFIVLTGFFGGLSGLWDFMALKAGGNATAVNAIDKFSLLFLLIFAFFFLGEAFTWTKAIGAILMTAERLLISFRLEDI